MHRLLMSIFLLTSIVTLQITPVFADKGVTVKRMDFTVPIPFDVDDKIPDDATWVCTTGNTNAAAWAIEGFIYPPERYKLAFDPMFDGDCGSICPQEPAYGFKVTAIHIVLQIADSCTLYMSVDLEEAVYPTSPDCPEPGDLICETSLHQIILPSSGLYDVALPLTECDCVGLSRKYLLSFHIESSSCIPALVTDAGPPTHCTNYNNYGGEWYDIVAAYPTWPGNLIFFAEAKCCGAPLPTEKTSWGLIKKMYNQ